jgi:hypothetical protein
MVGADTQWIKNRQGVVNPRGAHGRPTALRRLSRMGRYPTVTSCYTRSYEP